MSPGRSEQDRPHTTSQIDDLTIMLILYSWPKLLIMFILFITLINILFGDIHFVFLAILAIYHSPLALKYIFTFISIAATIFTFIKMSLNTFIFIPSRPELGFQNTINPSIYLFTIMIRSNLGAAEFGSRDTRRLELWDDIRNRHLVCRSGVSRNP